MRTVKPGQSGFSLIELAVVLMIVGILSGGILVAVSQVTEGNRRSAALAQLRMVEEALYGFAQVAGRLPCPATDASMGEESRLGGSGECELHHGFVPSGTLGLPGAVNNDGQLLDPWQNPLRYSVESSNTFTREGQLAAVFNSATVTTDIEVCNVAGCPADTVIVSNVPAIIYSMGANWATFTSDDEYENSSRTATLGIYPIADDGQFVMASYSEDNFDDQLLWLSPYVLFTRMVNAGRLP